MLFTIIADAQTITLSVLPSADAFVVASAPTNNYGAAGASSVSGVAGTNSDGQLNGVADSLARFPMSNLVSAVDAALGTHDWLVTRSILHLYEMGTPPHPIFSRGVGRFEIRWIRNDFWIEGTGIPSLPTTQGVSWQDLPTILAPGLDKTLGFFTNSGTDGELSFELTLVPSFVSDIRSGTEVGLYFTAASPEIGFTFDARSFVVPDDRPRLEITAAARPSARLDAITLTNNNLVSIGFNTLSNWNHTLQATDAANGLVSAVWSNLLSVPAQPSNGRVEYLDGLTNRQRFYRLFLTPDFPVQ